jgi:pimeloyl-ACP methyl ester carboxylesterase
MGGVVGMRLAARYPEKVRRLVLVATSGGFDLAAHGADDWRQEYRQWVRIVAANPPAR